MNKTWLVLRQEVITILTRRSFQLTAFGIPLLSTLIFVFVSLVNRSAPQLVTDILNPPETAIGVPEGYVDNSGIIHTIPSDIAEAKLRSYADEGAAAAALRVGEIYAYYLIPADYVTTGEVVYVDSEFNPMDAFDKGSLINQVLKLNLLGGDSQLATRLSDPFKLQVIRLEPSDSTLDDDSSLAFFLPYGVMLLYYMLILMSAGFLVSSLNKERENSVLEIMMATITPRQLLAGKFIGLGLIGLLVNVLWVGTGYGLLYLSGTTFQIPADYQLPAHILLWGGIYFVLGYAVYASLMGAVGAMLPNLRETSQATMVVILPMILPLMFISVMLARPNGLLAVSLSLFPLTSPVTMMLRLAVGVVPTWQLLLSVGLLFGAAYYIVMTVARMFRTQMMLSGERMNVQKLYRLITGKV